MTGVYVIEAPEVGRVKVGWSHDAHQRFIGLQVASPCELILRWQLDIIRPAGGELVAKVSDIARAMYAAPAIEALAHELLREHRWGGEWFEVDWEAAAARVVDAARAVLGDDGRFSATAHDPGYYDRRVAELTAEGFDPFRGLGGVADD